MEIVFHIFSSDFRHNYSDSLYYIRSISQYIYKNKKNNVTLTSFKPLSRQTRLSLSWEETFLFKSGSVGSFHSLSAPPHPPPPPPPMDDPIPTGRVFVRVPSSRVFCSKC